MKTRTLKLLKVGIIGRTKTSPPIRIAQKVYQEAMALMRLAVGGREPTSAPLPGDMSQAIADSRKVPTPAERQQKVREGFAGGSPIGPKPTTPPPPKGL